MFTLITPLALRYFVDEKNLVSHLKTFQDLPERNVIQFPIFFNISKMQYGEYVLKNNILSVNRSNSNKLIVELTFDLENISDIIEDREKLEKVVAEIADCFSKKHQINTMEIGFEPMSDEDIIYSYPSQQ